jgi:hypothetical protein
VKHSEFMKKLVVMLVGAALLLISEAAARAQSLTPDQLDQLVGPIALYPDPLIAEILPAATFPSQIVEADRYVNQGGDPSQIENQGWDPSVQALAHYGNVLKWMDDNLPWTTQLGQAFQNQQADVMDSVQRLRARAQNLGNLPSNAQESVVTDDGDIEIEPTDPDQMYVPDYQPDSIYYQAGIYCTFPYALPVGAWLGHDWNWHNHGLITWGPGHLRPADWWHRSPAQRDFYIAGHAAPLWRGGGRAAIVARGGWERGYEAPRQSAPIVVNVRPAPIGRQPLIAGRAPVERAVERPVERHEEFHSAPSAGFFVGGQSGHEAVESSSRGQASRASMGGGGGGGGGRHR